MFDKTTIKIYNSLTNSVEPFVPQKTDEISMYVCGPTVYNHIHIGNARPVIFFDTMKRFFQYIGYRVKMVMNFTDIDDKIIHMALQQGVGETVITDRYIQAFLDVCDALACEKDVIRPQVTENMEEIIQFIQELMAHGYAYQSGDDVYFRVRQVESYGILSNQRLDDLASGSRIDVNHQKEDPNDFVLWKKTSDVGRKWDSPFGKGRPGWHTECVVMIHKLFGGIIDIHGGGNDLKFPHHENEIAQSMALYHHTIAKYWIHNGRIDLRGEKMSKSLGNVIWLTDLLKIYPPQAYRLFVLASHYRQTINYLPDLMTQMVGEWEKIEKTYISLFRKLERMDAFKTVDVAETMTDFLSAMASDFNTANAFTSLINHLKVINKDLRNPNTSIEIFQTDYQTLEDMLYIFGIMVDVKPLTDIEKALVESWYAARNIKDFHQADLLRQQITDAGIKL